MRSLADRRRRRKSGNRKEKRAAAKAASALKSGNSVVAPEIYANAAAGLCTPPEQEIAKTVKRIRDNPNFGSWPKSFSNGESKLVEDGHG
jgi:hypothetical protein